MKTIGEPSTVVCRMAQKENNAPQVVHHLQATLENATLPLPLMRNACFMKLRHGFDQSLSLSLLLCFTC